MNQCPGAEAVAELQARLPGIDGRDVGALGLDSGCSVGRAAAASSPPVVGCAPECYNPGMAPGVLASEVSACLLVPADGEEVPHARQTCA